MTVEELKQKKAKAENDILVILTKLYDEAGMNIDYTNIVAIGHPTADRNKREIIVEIKLV